MVATQAKTLLLSTAILGHSLFFPSLGHSLFFPTFSVVDDIPRRLFAEQQTIAGYVERVIDGDTIRVRHCPRFSRCPPKSTSSAPPYLSTLKLRIYGVDCPELQKRKNDPPSQPYAEEAKEFTSNLLLEKRVRVKLLRKDQYGRAVAKVETSRRSFPLVGRRQDLSIELMRRGFATVYRGGGASYDGKKELLERLEDQARRRKVGVWSLDEKDRLSPSEFKRRHK